MYVYYIYITQYITLYTVKYLENWVQVAKPWVSVHIFRGTRHGSQRHQYISTAPRPSQSARSSTSSRFSAMVFLVSKTHKKSGGWSYSFPIPHEMAWNGHKWGYTQWYSPFLGKPNDVGSTRRVSNKMTRPDVGLLSIENRDSTYTTIRKQKTGISCIIYIRTIIYI